MFEPLTLRHGPWAAVVFRIHYNGKRLPVSFDESRRSISMHIIEQLSQVRIWSKPHSFQLFWHSKVPPSAPDIVHLQSRLCPPQYNNRRTCRDTVDRRAVRRSLGTVDGVLVGR